MTPEQLKQLQGLLGVPPTGTMDAETLSALRNFANAPRAPALQPPGPQAPDLATATVVQPDIENIINNPAHVGPGGTRSGPELAAQSQAEAELRDVGLRAHANREAMGDRQRQLLQLLSAQRAGGVDYSNQGVRLPDELFGGRQ